MFIVVSYDISDDQRRNKLANILKDYGKRVQYSVFECNLENKYIEQLIKETSSIIDWECDSLRIYRLCGECIEKTETYGNQNRFDKKNSVVV